MVGVQPPAGRFLRTGQRRGVLPYVRRKPRLGIFRPSADDCLTGLARRAPFRGRTGRAVFLHGAATALPLYFVAYNPSRGRRPARCGALRRPLGLDADVAALRLYRRARRPADDDHRAVPADIQAVLRKPPLGMALDGGCHGADGLQQISRGAGRALHACGDPPPCVPASDPISQRCGSAVAARAAFHVAGRARLGLVCLPSGGA